MNVLAEVISSPPQGGLRVFCACDTCRPRPLATLFGSLATDRIEEWSDLDLVIVAETEERFLDRVKEAMVLLRHGFRTVEREII